MIKKFINLTLAVAMISNIACQPTAVKEEVTLPSMSVEEKTARKFSAEVMLKMQRLSSPTITPSGKDVVYSVTWYDVENNKSYSNLWITDLASSEARQLTDGLNKDFSPRVSSDGERIFFLSTRSGESQIWSVALDGSAMRQESFEEGGVDSFNLQESHIWFAKMVKTTPTAKDKHSKYPESAVKCYDDLMVRHWDYWLDGEFSHIFVSTIGGDTITPGVDIMAGEPWDAPIAPYFSDSEVALSPDGSMIAYSSRKLEGKEYAESTNSDIYLYDIASGETRNLTEGMPGYDRNPVFSPDGTKIAWSSMERAGNESDKERLFVIDLSTGEKSYLTESFDSNAESYLWADNKTIYFSSPLEATYQICRVAISGGEVEVLTSGDHDYVLCGLYGDEAIVDKTTLSSASELVAVDLNSGKERAITAVNSDIYANVDMGQVQKRWVETTDGKQMLVWVILPPNFDESKKYPTLLYCQGGPQSVISQRWSYRWNFQLMASEGYIVVAPNRRGLQSFGQEWLDQISGDYSGQNIKDYLCAIDDVSKEPWVDTERRGCVGASYGGYSTYYLAGKHEGRFKAFISHCGMFNFSSFYPSTEELWFPNNDLGGSPWSNNPTAKRSYANSPHMFAGSWDTPIMIIVGLKDYRIPYTESLQAFTAARLNNLDSRLVVFEDEGHQVFKPQNALVWHDEFFGWLNKYLK